MRPGAFPRAPAAARSLKTRQDLDGQRPVLSCISMQSGAGSTNTSAAESVHVRVFARPLRAIPPGAHLGEEPLLGTFTLVVTHHDTRAQVDACLAKPIDSGRKQREALRRPGDGVVFCLVEREHLDDGAVEARAARLPRHSLGGEGLCRGFARDALDTGRLRSSKQGEESRVVGRLPTEEIERPRTDFDGVGESVEEVCVDVPPG